MQSKAKEGEYIGARIDPKLKRDFEKAAEKDSRSTSSALILLIKEYIGRMKSK